MHFHVLGPGSIGTLLTHHLRRTVDPKHAVVLLHRDKARQLQAQREGIVSVRSFGVTDTSSGYDHELSDSYAQPKHNTQNITYQSKRKFSEKHRSIAYPTPIQSLFVTLKAHAVLPAIRLLLPRIRPSTTIVLMHNGMGIYESLVDKLFRNSETRPHFILSSNTHGVYPIEKAYMSVVHASKAGSLKFGVAPDPRGRQLERPILPGDQSLSLDALSSLDDPDAAHYASLRNTVTVLNNLVGLNPSWIPLSELVIEMKRKTVVNSVINPLTAIMNCRNGELAISPHTARICRAICEEASLAFALEYNEEWSNTGRSFPPVRTAMTPHEREALLKRLPTSLSASALMREVYRVAGATRNNTSSMLQDVLKNRETEIQFMNGYLIGLGRRYNLHMRTTSTLANMLRLRQEIPLDQLTDLPVPEIERKEYETSREEKMLRRAWTLAQLRKFKRTRYRFEAVHTRRVLHAKNRRASPANRPIANNEKRALSESSEQSTRPRPDIDDASEWQY